MGGQVLGGGVIVLVAVVLWLVYLLPSWQGRHRYHAAERNAVRLNQALRVLAETSETPQEVELELNARTAAAQHKLARRVQAEREQAELAAARAQLEAARADAATARTRARAEAALARTRAKSDAAAARAAVRADAAAARDAARADTVRARQNAERARDDAARAREELRAEAARAAAEPAARRARARRRLRLTATLVAVAALATAAWGAFELVATATSLLLWISVPVLAACVLVLQRMARVQRRVPAPLATPITVREPAPVQDVSLADERAWTPRSLPRPLSASAGSRAAAVLDGAAARDALRQAALGEAMRERAERTAPVSLDAARFAHAAPDARTAGDAEIEAHVRRLLHARAVGQ